MSKLIQSMVSPYAVKPEETISALTIDKKVTKFMAELHNKFGVLFSFEGLLPDNPAYHNVYGKSIAIDMYTPTMGYKIGTARVDNFNRGEPEFVVISNLVIQKSRSVGHGRNARGSKKISSLMAAMKKADEEFTDTAVFNYHSSGVASLFGAIDAEASRSRINFSLSSDTQLALVKKFLGEDVYGVDQYKDYIVKQYDEYKEQRKKLGQVSDAMKRFAAGSRLIGLWAPDGMHTEPEKRFVTVSNLTATIDTRSYRGVSNIRFNDGMTRYSSVDEIPNFAIDKTIIRAAMESSNKRNVYSDLLLPINDHYYHDLDIATGYRDYTVMWLALPNEAFSE